MVVAILMGVAIGYGLKELTHISWLFWLGVIWGVLASFLNVYKAYKNMQKDYEELAKDPKYTQNKTNKSNQSPCAKSNACLFCFLSI